MGEMTRFSKNYHDLSTDSGYQFEFFCDHCGNGHRSSFQGSFSGRASQLLNAASTLIGGVLGSVPADGGSVRDAGWERAHEKAFFDAIGELSPLFIQCPHCMKWVCREECWDLKKGLCTECASDPERNIL